MARGRLTISLAAIQHNYRALAARAVGSACAAVVKADAYGLGAGAIAPALWQAGAREFFVAQAEEGIALRALLPKAAIYVLNGIAAGEAEAFLRYDLRPVLNDPGNLHLWQATARRRGTVLPAILHVDTGLNRLGFNSGDISRLAARPEALAGLDVAYVMSHLACADTPDHPMNKEQLERFEDVLQLLPGVKASLAASDGIFCGQAYHFDLVRPGAALYGLNPTPALSNPMTRCISLSMPILQVRTVERNGTAGYAATARVRAGQRLATVSLGYADGFARALSNKGHLYHGDVALPVIGRVSMDVVIVDLTPLGDKVPAELDVFCAHQDPDALARAMGTIGYEVLTGLGHRYERRYLS